MPAAPRLISPEKNKHRAKTEATLVDLLDAAETVFVRDGFEKAQIENIAAEFGRTRGSVYAHFKNKEDLFIALLERRVRARIGASKRTLVGLSSQQQRAWLRKSFENSITEERWYILVLEFKLFALRNKTSKARVKNLYKLLSTDIAQLFLQASAGDGKKIGFAAAVIRGIPSALILERQFDSVLRDADAARGALRDIFDLIIPE